MRYTFISEYAHEHSIALMCTVLKVSRSGCETSQKRRKIVEEVMGWLKTVGLMRKARHKGVARGGWMFTYANAVYNLIRMRNLVGEIC